jgi:hypothetical protein
MTFFGLISNVCIIFFTNTILIPLEFSFKILALVIVENLVLIIMLLFGRGFSSNLPGWFKYKEKIEITFLKKYSGTGDSNDIQEMIDLGHYEENIINEEAEEKSKSDKKND